MSKLPPLPAMPDGFCAADIEELEKLVLAYGAACRAAALEEAAQKCDEEASIEGIAQKCASAIRALKNQN